MKLKRFVASDPQKALKQVKEALGEDAVILSSHSVSDGVEMVAAIDYDESVINQKLPGSELITTSSSSDGGLEELKHEVQSLKELIENQLSGFAWQNISHFHPGQMVIIKRLIKLGFEGSLAEKLVQTKGDPSDLQKTWLRVLSTILEKIPQGSDLVESSGCFAFVGSTGVGKTTSIAKIAARYCLQHGADSLGLITLDGYRIAAVEQLVTYAKILGVSVSVAQNQEVLDMALSKLSDKKLILIDTAGMNPRDPRVKTQLDLLSNTIMPVKPILLFSAITQYTVLQDNEIRTTVNNSS